MPAIENSLDALKALENNWNEVSSTGGDKKYGNRLGPNKPLSSGGSTSGRFTRNMLTGSVILNADGEPDTPQDGSEFNQDESPVRPREE